MKIKGFRKRETGINEEAGYSNGDFIFCDEMGRTKIREVDNCIRAGIEVKSARDIRRTIASEMDRRGIETPGKKITTRRIIDAPSEINRSDVLKRTQND